MKAPEYMEGAEATRNFEEGMKALFNVSNDAAVQAAKKRKGRRNGPLLALRVYANRVFPTRTRVEGISHALRLGSGYAIPWLANFL